MICSICKTKQPLKAAKCPNCDAPIMKKGQPLKRFANHSFYGVSRHVPQSIKKQVRRECGFGCVVDGKMIIQYDHFDPEFVDLKEGHNASGIALLCRDCHGRKQGNNSELTNTMVANYRKKPYALKTGVASYPQFFLPPGPQFFRIGEMLFEANELIFQVGASRWLAIKQPEEEGGPVLIHTSFKMQTGETLLSLEGNVLTAYPSKGFDFYEKAASLGFSHNNNIFLELDRSDARTMEIRYAESWFHNYHIQIMNSGIYINGRAVFVGDIKIKCTQQMILNLDKMYRSSLK